MNQQKLVQFLSLWAGHSIFFVIFSVLLGNNLVLGNSNVSVAVATLFSGLLISIVIYFVPSVIEKSGYNFKLPSTTNVEILGFKMKGQDVFWGGFYFVVNAVVIWFIKRLAIITGLGISSILYVLILAVFATFAQKGINRAVDLLFAKK